MALSTAESEYVTACLASCEAVWLRKLLFDMVQRGAVKLQYVATEEQIANVLTKPLARVKFKYFREKLGVLQIEVSSKGK